jgi:hypothetical protein
MMLHLQMNRFILRLMCQSGHMCFDEHIRDIESCNDVARTVGV